MSAPVDHACPPKTNVVILPIRPVGHVVPLAAVFAARDIDVDEELGFDYADAGGEAWLFRRDDAPVLPETVEGGTKCLCGSEGCRGWLPHDATL